MHSFYSRFLDWGGHGAQARDPLLALPPYFRFVLAVQIARAWFNQQVHKPFHYVHLPSRPQNPNNQTEIELLSLEVLPAIFTLHNVDKCEVKVTWSKSKRLRRMTHEASFRTVFPAKKRHKEAFEAPCICFNALPEAFGRYSGKVIL